VAVQELQGGTGQAEYHQRDKQQAQFLQQAVGGRGRGGRGRHGCRVGHGWKKNCSSAISPVCVRCCT